MTKASDLRRKGLKPSTADSAPKRSRDNSTVSAGRRSVARTRVRIFFCAPSRRFESYKDATGYRLASARDQ